MVKSSVLKRRTTWLVLFVSLAFAVFTAGWQTVPPPISPSNAALLTQVGEISFIPWDLVMAVTWSPDGEYLAVSAGSKIHLVGGNPLDLIVSVDVGAFTHGLAFSPDGVWLASASRDGFLRIWRVADLLRQTIEPLPVLVIQAHRKGANSVAFSPDGSFVVSGGNDAVARFWNPSTGELLGQVVGGTFAVPSIAVAPDGKFLAVVNGDVIRLRQVGSERIIGTLLAETPLYSVAISPNGRVLAASDINNMVLLWDPERAFRTGQEKYPQPVELVGHVGLAGSYRSLVWKVVFSPDGRLLASAGGDATVRLWDVTNGKLLVTLPGHSNGVTCVAFHPQGYMLASGSLDGTLRFWRVQ